MGAHNDPRQLYNASHVIADPGDAKTIVCNEWGCIVDAVTAAAETRTLAQPTKTGVMVVVNLKTDGGDLTLTVTGGYNQAADTSITYNTAGDWVAFYSIDVGGSYYWRVLSSEGTTLAGGENALTGVTAGTATASKALVLGASKEIATITTLGATTVNAPTVNATDVDAGASGTPGSVDVFPTTAARGKLAITCTNQTGNTTVSVVAGAMADARTLTIPDPGAAASFVMTAGTQAIANATITDLTATSLKLAVSAVAAAGSAIGEGGNLAAGLNVVSAADNTTCVDLPATVAGTVVVVVSATAAKKLPVFPAASSSIDNAAANTAITIGASTGYSSAIFIADNATHWVSILGDTA